MQRIGLAIIAATCLAVAFYLRLVADGSDEIVSGGLLRAGLVVGALWLAYPQLALLPRWLAGVVLGVLALVSWRPKILWIALPALLLLLLLRPRRGPARWRSAPRGPR